MTTTASDLVSRNSIEDIPVWRARSLPANATVTRGGALGLSGEIFLEPGNRYALDLVLRPTAAVGSDTRELLAAALQSHPTGGYVLKTGGRF